MRESASWHRYLRFWRQNVAADVDDEIAFHIDARAQELIDSGMTAAAARERALREFGDVGRARGVLRTMDEQHAAHQRRSEILGDLWSDVRIALRSLRKSPGFVLVVSITLAFGIGLNSAVYSIVDAYLFRPLPVANGKALVMLGQVDAGLAQPHELSYPNYKDYRADTAIFRDLAAYVSNSASLADGRSAERVFVDDVTANYFSVLGVRPFLGRYFLPGEDVGELAHPFIVLSYKFWKAHYDGNPRVVGDTIRLNNQLVTVIGVTPPEFHGVNPVLDVDGFTPFNQTWPSYGAGVDNRERIFLYPFGLLRPGLSLARAREMLKAKAAQLEHDYPATNKNVGVILVPEVHARPALAIAGVVPTIAAAFMMLVVLVLLIACANVTSLLLARAASRRKELAIRAALGASHWRLARQVLVESLLLSMLGGVGAVFLARLAIGALFAIPLATDVPFRWGIQLDNRVVAFTFAIVVVTAIVAGVAPALGTRRADLHDVLKSGARGSSGGTQQRVRSALVVAQIAVSLVVLACAGLFARSSANALRMDLGFRSDHVLMMSLALREQGYDSLRGKPFYRDVLQRVQALSGVRAASLAAYTPFGYNNDLEHVFPEASPVAMPDNGFTYFNNVVTPDYFAAMGMPMLEGRRFTPRDDENAPKVVVINRAFATAVWPKQAAVGKRFHYTKNGPLLEVVGIVRDAQYMFVGETPKPFFFRPHTQWYRSAMTLFVNTEGDPAAAIKSVRAVVSQLDPQLAVFDVRTMESHLTNGRALLFTNIGTAFAAIFGLLALLLASVGVYGLISYSVAQRTREIGIRVALGAKVSTVMRMVVRQGLGIAAVGIVAGLAAALVTTHLLESILYNVAPRDPLILGGVALGLTAVAVVASLVPARRATRVDPLTALRAE